MSAVAGRRLGDVTLLLEDSYPALAGVLPSVRRSLRAVAGSVGASEQQREKLALAISEAVTNVIVHAYNGGAGEMHVTAAVKDGMLSVVVADDGRGLGGSADTDGLGFGVRFIGEAADEAVVRSRPAGGVEVRMGFELACSDSE
jgi:anti-sigma regulatory factor (Ser/Thr protein kinase)